MPSAKRRFDRGPVSLEVYNRFNTNKHETWWDVKAKQDRERQRQPTRYLFGDQNLGEEY